jgi:hypothetical protein
MRLTTCLLAALCWFVPGTALADPPAALMLHLNVVFDRSISSNLTRKVAKEEAAAIWSRYGVELLWADPEAEAALSLNVFVERHNERINVGTGAVLGRTIVAAGVFAPSPIFISFDAITALFDAQRTGDPLSHDLAVAMALGRVLAHEIGHVLLGAPGYHDADGLMRLKFLPQQLASPERSQFRLTPRSAERLRSRIAALSEASSVECDANSIP